MKPFAPNVWLAVIVVMFIIMIIYPIFAKAAECGNNDWFMNSLYIFGSLMSQDIPEAKTTSLNVFIIVYVWYSFFIHSIFDCNLRAYMMAADKMPQVDSVRDIWDQVKTA